jgi:predicted O-linked N-acetylglucosamine transferase (SPINDLY family)
MRRSTKVNRQLKLELADARAGRDRESAFYISACKERDEANYECDAALAEQQGLQQTIKNLRVEVSARAEQTRVLMGSTVDTLNEDQRKNLRADLEAALKRVDTWQAAEEAVGKKRPELCCPLSLHERLMHDPVMTLDGRTYERLAINKHFEMLVRSKQPIMSPQKDPLASALVVPNVTLKKHIVAMVQEKAEELAAGSGGKRRRED